MNPIRQLAFRVKDELQYSAPARELRGRMLGMAARLAGRSERRLSLMTRAIALCDRPKVWKQLITSLKPEDVEPHEWQNVINENPRLRRILQSDPHLSRTVILKSPAERGEKGLIVVYFEYNLARLLALPSSDLQWLTERYEIALAASWTPTNYGLLGLAANMIRDGIWVQAATNGERDRIAAFHSKIRTLPGLACDWVEPAFYKPRPWTDRTIDILMVANWGEFKRHWEFFDALRKLPENFKVVLIGQKEGTQTLQKIESLASAYAVPQNLEFFESLPIDEVTRMQCDSKISVVLSRREGGCVAMVESLFAGCVIAMRKGASIGSAAHINESTGGLLRPGHIAEDLLLLHSRGGEMSPRQWALEHISCYQTLAAIQATLKARATESGRAWTADLAQPFWRPHPTIASQEDRDALRPAYDELHKRLPTVFPADLISASCR